MGVPIRIEAYDPRWATRFAELRAELRELLGSMVIGFEHVGSTAIPGLCAKPITTSTCVDAAHRSSGATWRFVTT